MQRENSVHLNICISIYVRLNFRGPWNMICGWHKSKTNFTAFQHEAKLKNTRAHLRNSKSELKINKHNCMGGKHEQSDLCPFSDTQSVLNMSELSNWFRYWDADGLLTRLRNFRISLLFLKRRTDRYYPQSAEWNQTTTSCLSETHFNNFLLYTINFPILYPSLKHFKLNFVGITYFPRLRLSSSVILPIYRKMTHELWSSS